MSIPVFSSSDDSGYAQPGKTTLFASYPEVTAVGGVNLTQVSPSVSPRRWTETAYVLGGSGCATGFSKPPWQTDTGCNARTVADISAAADSFLLYFNGAWHSMGGTSGASPFAAAVFAATGQTYNLTPQFPYATPGDFHDVTKGSNGTCSPAYLCTAGAGYDGPTGIGTPNGYAMQGYWLTTTTPNASVAKGGQVYLTVNTNDYWAQDSSKLSFSVIGLPSGVAASYGAITSNSGNPYITITLSASASAPVTSLGARSTVTAIYNSSSGTVVHTMSFFLDVTSCKPSVTSCTYNGVPGYCGNVPNGCGGTLACGNDCGDGTCQDNVCSSGTRNPPPNHCPCGGVYPHCQNCQVTPVGDGGPPNE